MFIYMFLSCASLWYLSSAVEVVWAGISRNVTCLAACQRLPTRQFVLGQCVQYTISRYPHKFDFHYIFASFTWAGLSKHKPELVTLTSHVSQGINFTHSCQSSALKSATMLPKREVLRGLLPLLRHTGIIGFIKKCKSLDNIAVYLITY